MRLSTVSEVQRRTSTRPLRRLLVFLTLLTALSSAAFAAYRLWPLLDPPVEAHDEPTVEDPHLTNEEALLLLTLRRTSGAAEIARHRLGDRKGADAARTLALLLQARLNDRALRPLPTPAFLQRGTLPLPLLSDHTLTAIFNEGHEAHLYPEELTLLLWAIAQEAHLDIDLVLLPHPTPDVDRWPTVALRVLGPGGGLVIDPSSGELHASNAPGAGPSLILASLALLDARAAHSRGDLDAASLALSRASRLAPNLWTSHALLASLALSHADLPLAQSHAQHLTHIDHPFAWFISARVAVALDLQPDAHIERLRAIVDAFPFEARLCVALGDALSDARRFRDAWDAYELALTRDPSVAGAHTGLALLYALADPDRAMQHLHAELEHNADFAPTYLALAFVHTLNHAPGDAQRVAQQGRRLAADPDAYDARLQSLISRIPDDR